MILLRAVHAPTQATARAPEAVRGSAEFDPVDQIQPEKAMAVASLPEPQAKTSQASKARTRQDYKFAIRARISDLLKAGADFQAIP